MFNNVFPNALEMCKVSSFAREFWKFQGLEFDLDIISKVTEVI